MASRTNITTPVGRIVAGNLYTPNTKDFDGKPLVVKTGANIGQARSDFFFAIAIKKEAEQHWAQTAWGAEIWRVGHTAFPQAAQSPTFAWKIDDGDSQVPNKRGKKPCDNEGWRGHWILKFSGGFAPKVYREEAGGGYVQLTESDYVKPGHFVQVLCTVDGNGNQNNPGVYLNHSMVCFRAFGPEISFGPNVNEAGFGAAPLPAGATLTPPASAIPMPAAAAALPSAPAAIPAPIASIPVTPNPQFLQVPATGVPAATLPSPIAAVPSPVPAVPVVPTMPVPIASPSSGPKMTAKAEGSSYQAFISAGWTDANLIANGYMTV